MPDTEQASERPTPQSPIADEFIDELLAEFHGLWAFEDNEDLRGRVDDLVALIEVARDFFLKDLDGDGFLLEFDPSPEVHDACLALYYRAGGIFERAELDDFEGLVDTARMLCHFPKEMTDAQILAVLAIREIGWAITFIGDICRAYQEEIEPYLGPLGYFRAKSKDDYFKHETEHRAKNWWLERNKLADSEMYKGRAQMLLVLAKVAARGIDSKPIQSFVVSRMKEGRQYEQQRRSISGGKAKRGHKLRHTKAIAELAKSWRLWTASGFRNRLAKELDKSKCPRFKFEVNGEAIWFWLDSATPRTLMYKTSDDIGGLVGPETLKSILQRAKVESGIKQIGCK